MPTLDQHQSTRSIKMLLLGDSGTGKTGALASLVSAGYKLRIWDFDNGLDYLVARVRKDCPDKLKNVAYQTFHEDKWKLVGVNTIIYERPPADFQNAVNQLDNWSDGALGKPADWDDSTIVVIDSLTFLGKAAYRYSDMLNPGAKDKRQTFFQGQQNVASILSKLTASSFKPNVIIICHIDYQETEFGVKKGYPRSLGSAMNPEIPSYFNTCLLAETVGSGASTKRMIKTAPTGIIDLKSSVILPNFDPLPLETGLASFFAMAKASNPAPAKSN